MNDLVSKHLLKRITLDIARWLLQLRVEEAELLETQTQRVEERRADLVARMIGEEGRFILHIEVQNDNRAEMPWRMLRYRCDLALEHPGEAIRQVLLYIGKKPLAMVDGLTEEGLDYRYRLIDMHRIDCQALLALEQPEALVLAILCDFRDHEPRQVVRQLLTRLYERTAHDEVRRRDLLLTLEILSANRDLQRIVKEEAAMLSQTKWSDLPSYQIGFERGLEDGLVKGVARGMEQGMAQGMAQGEARLLERILDRRFGPLPERVRSRLQAASEAELERWAEKALDAPNLAAIFEDQ